MVAAGCAQVIGADQFEVNENWDAGAGATAGSGGVGGAGQACAGRGREARNGGGAVVRVALRAAQNENSRSARAASLANRGRSPSTVDSSPEKHSTLTRQRFLPTYSSFTRLLVPTIVDVASAILPADSVPG
jgi:hypothetical protein